MDETNDQWYGANHKDHFEMSVHTKQSASAEHLYQVEIIHLFCDRTESCLT